MLPSPRAALSPLAAPDVMDGQAQAGAPLGTAGQDSFGLIELYVALKAKSVAILCGSAGSGKLAAARAVGSWLAGSGPASYQEMVGHAWWASRCEAVALFTEAQQRFNHDKIMALMEEAARDPAAGSISVALLSRISPAEWGYLMALASRLYCRPIIPGADGLQRGPAAGPPVLLIATADTAAPRPWDSGLLRTTSVIPWSDDGAGSARFAQPEWPPNEGVGFLQACVRSPEGALRRLRGLPCWTHERLRPLLAVTRAMAAHGVPDANRAASEALLYLANAWSWAGAGLFSPSLDENFQLALQLAVVLAILPRLEGQPSVPGQAQEGIAAILEVRPESRHWDLPLGWNAPDPAEACPTDGSHPSTSIPAGLQGDRAPAGLTRAAAEGSPEALDAPSVRRSSPLATTVRERR